MIANVQHTGNIQAHVECPYCETEFYTSMHLQGQQRVVKNTHCPDCDSIMEVVLKTPEVKVEKI